MPSPEVSARIDEIRAAAARTANAPDPTRMKRDEIPGLAQALPGARIAEILEEMRPSWNWAMEDLRDRIHRYGEGLTAAADLYTQVDEQAAADLDTAYLLGGSWLTENALETGRLDSDKQHLGMQSW